MRLLASRCFRYAVTLMLLWCSAVSNARLANGQAVNADFGRELFSVNLGPGLDYVTSIAVDNSASSIYVIDIIGDFAVRGRLRKLTYSTGTDVSTAFLNNNQLGLDSVASAVAVDSRTNDVYASNQTAVFRLSSSGTLLMTYPQTFSGVNSMTIDRHGNLIVADGVNIDTDDDFDITVYNITADGVVVNQTTFYPDGEAYLVAIAVDSTDNVYYTGASIGYIVGDGYINLAGVGVMSPTGQPLMNLLIRGYEPTSLWVSASDVLFVAWEQSDDYYDFQATGYVLSYDTTTWQITGNFSANSNTNPVAVSGDNQGNLIYADGSIIELVKLQIATSTVLSTIRNGVEPEILSVDSSGNMYILDAQAGAVLILDSAGTHIKYIPATTDGSVILVDAAVDAAGTFLVGVQNNGATLRCYDVSSGALLRTIPNFPTRYNYISSVAVDSSHNIYFAYYLGYYNGQNTGVVRVVSQLGASLYNISAFGDEDLSVVIDSHDQLFISNSSVLLKCSLNGTAIESWQTSAYLSDSNGYLYGWSSYIITYPDSYGFDIVAYTPNLGKNATLQLGSFHDEYFSGLAVDRAGDFYVSDIIEHTVTKYRGLSSAAPLLPSLSSSSSSSSSTAATKSVVVTSVGSTGATATAAPPLESSTAALVTNEACVVKPSVWLWKAVLSTAVGVVLLSL